MRLRKGHVVGSLAALTLMAGQLSWADTLCSTPALPIPDNTSNGISDTIVLTNGALDELTDMDISINTSHTWVGDLVFTLEHESTGLSVVVIDRPGFAGSGFGCPNDDIDAVLDDSANTPVENECSAIPPAIDGAHAPNNPLSFLNGQNRTGTWILTASDNADGDTGTLNEWCLTFTFNINIDTDGDGVPDSADNCTEVANPGQIDTNGDGIGNICDPDVTGPGSAEDCFVNFADLQSLKDAFFSSPPAPNWNPDVDFDSDGFINFLDLQIMKNLFFGPPGPSATGCI